MSELFNRDISVQIGTTLIASRTTEEDAPRPTLRMTFKIEKALKKEPNTADLQIYNLSEKTRSQFQEEKTPVIIKAGYVDNVSQIFSGEMSHGSSTKQGVDWITRFQAGDGEVKYRSSRINESFKPGVGLVEMVKKTLTASGLGVGNVIKKITAGNFRGALEQMANGAVLSGNATDTLDGLAKTMGFEMQIHDGQVEFYREGETTEDTAIRLTAENGLLGSPEIGEKGAIKARSLLQGGLFPARKIEVISREVDGFFQVRQVTHSGDTAGGDWYSDIEAVPL